MEGGISVDAQLAIDDVTVPEDASRVVHLTLPAYDTAAGSRIRHGEPDRDRR